MVRPFCRHVIAVSACLLLFAGCRRSGFPDYPAGYREFAYITNSGGNTVTILDLVYLRADRTVLVGRQPVSAVANPLRDEVYVVNTEPGSSIGSVTVIDTRTNQVAASIPVRREPISISVEPTGHRAYVANTGSNSVSTLDLDTRRVIGTVATSDAPTSALVSPDGRTVVVTHPGSGSISLMSAGARGTIQPSLLLRNTFTGCAGASAPVILPDSSRAFVACTTVNKVMAISLAMPADSWPARQDASLLTDHVLALLDVGAKPIYLTLKPDGGEIFVSNSVADSVTEISTQTNEVGSTFVIGNRPAHGVVSADNGALWIANSGADSVSLYSIDDGKLLPGLHTGISPDALAFSSALGPDKPQPLLIAVNRSSGDVALIRTTTRQGPPSLFTLLPAGSLPSSIAVKAMLGRP